MPQPISVGAVLGGRYRITEHVVTSADQDMVFLGTDQVLNRRVTVLVASRENATQVASSARELATGERTDDVQVLDLGLSEGRTYLIAGGGPDPDVLLGLAYPQEVYVEPFQTDTLGSEIFGESRTEDPHAYDDDEVYYTDLDRRLRADEDQTKRRPGFLNRISERISERVRPSDGTAAKAAAGASALAAADAATRAQQEERERAEREERERKEREERERREAEERAERERLERERREAEERERVERERREAEARAEQERLERERREAEERARAEREEQERREAEERRERERLEAEEQERAEAAREAEQARLAAAREEAERRELERRRAAREEAERREAERRAAEADEAAEADTAAEETPSHDGDEDERRTAVQADAGTAALPVVAAGAAGAAAGAAAAGAAAAAKGAKARKAAQAEEADAAKPETNETPETPEPATAVTETVATGAAETDTVETRADEPAAAEPETAVTTPAPTEDVDPEPTAPAPVVPASPAPDTEAIPVRRQRPVPRRAMVVEPTTPDADRSRGAGAPLAAAGAGAVAAAGATAASAAPAGAAPSATSAPSTASAAPEATAADTSPADGDGGAPVDPDQGGSHRGGWPLALLLLAVLVGALVLGGVLLAQNLRGAPTEQAAPPASPTETAEGTDPAPGAPTQSDEASPTESSPAASTSASPTESETAAAAPQPARALRMVPDLPAHESEHDGELPNLIDGDPSTAWRTFAYARPNFGGYVESMNLVVELEDRAKVNEVTLQSTGATGGAWFAYIADSPEGENAREIGNGTFDQDSVTVPVPFDGAEAEYVIVSLTSLPRLDGTTPDLPFGLRLGEIGVR